jgi:hypothetical protein
MQSLSECLEATHLAITQSNKLLCQYHNHATEVQLQVDNARRLIAESFVTLKTLEQVVQS